MTFIKEHDKSVTFYLVTKMLRNTLLHLLLSSYVVKTGAGTCSDSKSSNSNMNPLKYDMSSFITFLFCILHFSYDKSYKKASISYKENPRNHHSILYMKNTT